jgi:hypothetical protein
MPSYCGNLSVALDSNLHFIGLTNSVLSVLNAFFNMLTLFSLRFITTALMSCYALDADAPITRMVNGGVVAGADPGIALHSLCQAPPSGSSQVFTVTPSSFRPIQQAD